MRRLLLIACLFGCGGHSAGTTDPILGDPCTTDTQCAHRCATGPQYPGGFCTESCTTDADCPPDAVCIKGNTGVCLFTCPPFDCTFLGANWRCDNRDRIGGGQAMVCTGG